MTIQRVTDLPPLPPRPDDANKGTFGRVLIVGGSRGMSGAACLAGLGALRGGAGLVYLAVPSEIMPIVAAVEPSYLTIPVAQDDVTGRLGNVSRLELDELVSGKDAVAIGPGWGTSPELVDLAESFFSSVTAPLVIDADALNALAESQRFASDASSPAPAPRILTPHPGEFSRLTGAAINDIQQNREEYASQFAKRHGLVLLLKGQHTVITDGERLAVNPTGNSGMATGGSGDVLTGLIAALLAQGMDAFEAAQLGAYLHGLAGDLAAEELSKPGLIASDLPQFLANALSLALQVRHDS